MINKTKLKDIFIKKKLIFNKCDIDDGEGFYPMLYNETNLNKLMTIRFKSAQENLNFKPFCVSNKKENFDYYMVNIIFYPIPHKNNIAWIQYNGHAIMGFDNNNGLDILKSLNEESKIDGVFILNSSGRIVYPVTYNSTYRVLGQLPDEIFI